MKTDSKNDRQPAQSNPKITAPAVVTVDECQYAVKVWNSEGFEIEDFDREAEVGDCFPIQFRLVFKGGIDLAINTQIELIATERHSSKFRFLNLRQPERELLQKAIRNLQQGDLKTKKIPEDELGCDSDRDESRLVFLKPDLKKIFGALLYLVLGGAIVTGTLYALYKSVLTLEIESAAIATPVEPIVSTHRGIVSQIYIQEGMEVKANQPLLQIHDQEMAKSVAEDELQNLSIKIRRKQEEIDELTRQLQLSRLELAEAKVELQNVETLQQQEIERLKQAENIAQSEQKAARAQVNALRVRYREAKKRLERFSFLLRSGAVSQQRVDGIKADVAELAGDLETAEAQLNIAQTKLDSVEKGSFYNGNRFVGELPRLQAEVRESAQAVQTSTQKISVLKQTINKYQQEIQALAAQKQAIRQQNSIYSSEPLFTQTYQAPVSGSVMQIDKELGNRVNRDETLLYIEPDLAQPTVEAYLTQAEAAYLSIGKEATVKIFELDRQYQAQVVEIARAGGLPDEANPLYELQGSQEKPVHVKLKLVDLAAVEADKLTSGMPVKVYLTKKDKFNFGWFKQALAQ